MCRRGRGAGTFEENDDDDATADFSKSPDEEEAVELEVITDGRRGLPRKKYIWTQEAINDKVLAFVAFSAILTLLLLMVLSLSGSFASEKAQDDE